ncbi:Zinc finger, RING-type [Corchorus capsularis]|uniref:Zinc finger, RING-type n=1 Tax=Corchorus capsularis TaxID=210143 RepID=A0A1R3H9I1_COCAP|nr:Zinc finger, RING-type [Corchorus capsularis]
MSVRFKFRSSPNYDSVDIGGLPWISVRDLKSRIVKSKKLNLCQDFDLLFSDSISGQEYVNEDFQILCGSSVIIKRVPAGGRVGSLENVATKQANISKASYPVNVETVDFDDFGAELCAIPGANISDIGLDIENKFCVGDEKTNIELKRCAEQPAVECHKPEVSDIIEAVPQGLNASKTKSKVDIEPNTKLPKVVIARSPAMQAADFPSELKCSLCNSFFKEAVMIPCCQHSFCEKCIRHVLLEKARCPKCLSTRCKVEDLLPNVSLRQAIERFLKSQILINDAENALHRDVPDGESGIQVKEVSCAVSVLQRAECAPCSPATGRRSNQGENQPLIEGGESNVKKKRALRVNTAGKSCVDTGRLKKGDRACYMCGSPDHLRRDCPDVFSQHPMLERGNGMFQGAMPGYLPPYWNGPPFPNIRPFANPYGNSGMMPFNASMIPGAPYPIPTYVTSMFGGSPAFGGFTQMGGITAAGKNNIEHQLFRSDLDVQDYDKRRQFISENVDRKHFYDEDDVKRHQYDGAKRPLDKKLYPDREKSATYSQDSYTKKSLLKHWHSSDDDVHSDEERHEKVYRVAGENRRPYYSERSRSEVDDMPSSSSWHTEERHRHGHSRSKKHNDRREQCDTDSSRSHYPTNKEKSVNRKTVKHDAERRHQKHNSLSESSLEPNHSSDWKKKTREKDSGRSTRHSGHKSKSTHDDLCHDRWQMVSRSDEDNQEYHYYKRKKVY